MSKIELSTISSGYNLSKINENFQKLEDALNTEVLYRDSPEGEDNSLQTDVDANGKRILNLPEPVSADEPVRKQDLDAVSLDLGSFRDDMEELRDDTEELKEEANQSAISAAESANSAQVALEATEAVSLDFGLINNRMLWEMGEDYSAGDIWQDNTTYSWYYVPEPYTSGLSEAADIANGDAYLYAGIPYTYSYFFVNEVLGDKYENGALFNDADTADLALGEIFEGTASLPVMNAFNKINEQLGFKAED
jgi:hypothetical protein